MQVSIYFVFDKHIKTMAGKLTPPDGFVMLLFNILFQIRGLQSRITNLIRQIIDQTIFFNCR